MKKRKVIILLILFGIGIAGWSATKLWAYRNDLFTYLKIFSHAVSIIKKEYVREVDSKELIENAINGMLQELDPYSGYLTEKQYNELKVETKGEFGGLGIHIGIRNKVLTIISPMEGTPAARAGLLAGDKIIEIEGKSTEGITIEEAISKLRGEPGTKVTITISREGVRKPFKITITREIIRIRSVPYAAKINDDIGYIKFLHFSKDAHQEIKKAIDSLFLLGVKKIIFDLRNNPGGLLEEGIAVADLFLDEGKTIVITRGRKYEFQREYIASPESYKEFPMVILVNMGSSSASEIFTGALQDWERAVVLGDTTFGKGSVQTLYPIKETGGAIKLTRAYWYTPSGRCIDAHKVELERKKREGKETVFYTLGKRRLKLKGEGGIIPDLVMEIETPESYEFMSPFVRENTFFSYAVTYVKRHKKIQKDFIVTDAILQDFKKFAISKGVKFKDEEFLKYKEDVKIMLEREIASKIEGIQGDYRVRVKYDPLVKKAIELLKKSPDLFALFEALEK